MVRVVHGPICFYDRVFYLFTVTISVSNVFKIESLDVDFAAEATQLTASYATRCSWRCSW